MKKYFKRVSLIFVSVLLAALSVSGAFADTIYNYSGYSYTIINNYSVSLCGWDNSSPELKVPAVINARNVTDISNRAFMGNSGITSVDFSQAKNLSRIGLYAFKDCSGLSGGLDIPATVTTLENAAFEGCSSITSVTINADVTAILAQCFNKCSSLTSAVIPEYIESIGNYAFANCPELTYLELSRSVTSIANSSFNNDANLTLGVYYGSYAHEYAVNKGISYRLLDGVKLGDVNGDGDIDVNDVTLIQKHIAGLSTLEGIYLYAADTNLDKDVDIIDATVTQKHIAGYDIPYPVGETITG